MKSKDRVRAVFEHQIPDRVPCWCGSSEEFWLKAKNSLKLTDEQLRIFFHDDFRRIFARYQGPTIKAGAGAKTRNIFGIDRQGLGYGQPLNHPLAHASIREIRDYHWPNPLWMDVSSIGAEAAAYSSEYAILGGDWSPFWHDVIDLFGMENLFLKMYSEPAGVKLALQAVSDYYFEVSNRIFDAAGDLIDIFFIGNDFGSQCGPLLGPDLFREFILPHLARLVDLGHAYGIKVQLHCCGGIEPLIPLIIEAGVDALHAVQPGCHGMDLQALKDAFGRKIVFNGAIDSHHVLIEGNADSVRIATRKVLDIMMPGGGYIGGASHDAILEETPVENITAMFDTICEYGVYL